MADNPAPGDASESAPPSPQGATEPAVLPLYLLGRIVNIRLKEMHLAQKSGLANPSRLKPTDGGDDVLQVVVETPKGCRNKFAFDPEQRVFVLRKVLPAGMSFPYDFGFLPRTTAEDADPIDVLLLMDEPAFPGVIVRSRVIGVIEGVQKEGQQTIRNDRLLAVAEGSHLYANVRRVSDLPGHFLEELQQFFVNYARLEGKEYKLLGCKGTDEALRLIKNARCVAQKGAA